MGPGCVLELQPGWQLVPLDTNIVGGASMKQGQDGTVPHTTSQKSHVGGGGGLPREGTAPSPWCAVGMVGSGCQFAAWSPTYSSQGRVCSEGECLESRGEPHPQFRVSWGWEAGSMAAPSQRQV